MALFFLQAGEIDLIGLALPIAGMVLYLVVSFFVVSFFNERFSSQAFGGEEKNEPVLQKHGTQAFGARPQVQSSYSFEKKPEPKKFDVSSIKVGPNEKEQNLIKTIKELLRNATPEEEIVQNLRALGLDEKSAKKLVLIAESDAIEVFRDEIEKITKKNVEEQISKIQQQIEAPPAESFEQKVRTMEESLGSKLSEAQKTTKKPKEKIVLNLMELQSQLEEIKLPELKKRFGFEKDE